MAPGTRRRGTQGGGAKSHRGNTPCRLSCVRCTTRFCSARFWPVRFAVVELLLRARCGEACENRRYPLGVDVAYVCGEKKTSVPSNGVSVGAGRGGVRLTQNVEKTVAGFVKLSTPFYSATRTPHEYARPSEPHPAFASTSSVVPFRPRGLNDPWRHPTVGRGAPALSRRTQHRSSRRFRRTSFSQKEITTILRFPSPCAPAKMPTTPILLEKTKRMPVSEPVVKPR